MKKETILFRLPKTLNRKPQSGLESSLNLKVSKKLMA